MTQSVTIRNSHLTAIIAVKGGELQSLIPDGGTDVMWSADPDIWPWHAPNLFPIVGALADDVLLHEGKSYPIKQHGFLRHSLCAVVKEEVDACSFQLTDNAETRKQYPFPFVLTLTYRLNHDRLDCVFALHNPAATPLYASLGAHPAFRWPLRGAARDAHIVLFDQQEPEPIRRLEDRLLAPASVPTPVDGRVLHLTDALFDNDALIFDRLASRKITFGVPGGPGLELDFADFSTLGIWTKPDGVAPFLCLEPWQGTASPIGFAGEFSEKPGVAAIAPHDTRVWHYSIRPLSVMPGLPH